MSIIDKGNIEGYYKLKEEDVMKHLKKLLEEQNEKYKKLEKIKYELERFRYKTES